VRLCLDKDGVIVEWVRRQIPLVSDFGRCTALGLTDDNGAPLAGAVYHDYQPHWQSVMISFAASTPRWATRNTVGMFLRYPFAQLGVHKLRAAVPHSNARSLKLTAGVGFVQEAILKDEFGKGSNAVLFRMFERDFLRLYDVEKGRRIAA
jgi:RimJ/RimL family protein N-acetyltransferase